MVNLTPTGTISTAAKRGLALVEAGRGGDGLVEQTLQDARRMAAGKALSESKVRAMPGWFARHAADRKPGWDKKGEETPGFVAFLLWGGDTAAAWAERKVAQLDKQNQKSRRDMAENDVVEPGEGTPEDAVTDLADCVEELSEALADVVVFKARSHGAHWNVKGPAFGAYHELFGEIYEDVDGSIDPIAEQLLKLDIDAPSTLGEFQQRSTIQPEPIGSDDPQALALDLRDMNDQVLDSLEDAYDCASEFGELAGLCNLLAERIDMHRKWRWQLTRSISNPAEAKVEAPMNPPEASEVEEDDNGMLEVMRSAVGAAEIRSNPSVISELRAGGDVVEQRNIPTKIEVRSQADGSWTLTGLAAVFDSMSEPLGGFTEVIKRGAFKNVLSDPNLDVRALFNHDPNMPLARSTNGTLELRETPRGLEYTATVPAGLSYGDDLRILLENGTITQSSFAFKMPSGGEGQDWTDGPDGTLVRTITNFGALLDCSPVTYPAYRAATAGVRNETSDDSSERGDQADAAEQVTAAEESRLREEMERARRERELRLRERKLAQSTK